jgi:NAD(P)-dependent dehydrogenase (short-subunit alcohol dehydrogenase family)
VIILAKKGNRLDGDVAFVSGAASGLNRGVALEFARNGAVVICADINNEGNQETVELIKSEGGEAYAIHMDISKRQSVREAGEKAMAIKNKLTILINGAGVGSTSTLEDCSDEEYDRVMDINLRGYFNSVMEIAPYVVHSGVGRIVMISSSTAKSGGHQGGPAYAASKGGVISMMRHCALNWAKKNCRVNCICPGFADTPFGYDPRQTKEENEARLQIMKNNAAKAMPLGRLCMPEDIAGICMFLVTDESAYVTGYTIDATGGRYIYNT